MLPSLDCCSAPPAPVYSPHAVDAVAFLLPLVAGALLRVEVVALLRALPVVAAFFRPFAAVAIFRAGFALSFTSTTSSASLLPITRLACSAAELR